MYASKSHILSKELLTQKYIIENKTIRQISKEIKISEPTLKKYLELYNIKQRGKRKYEFNQDYFKTWSSNMAYILGFISADGSISTKGQLQISLARRDKNILIFIKSQMNSESPIRDTTSNNTEQASFVLTSPVMQKDLANFGVVPNKTRTLRLPTIPEEYKYDYLRGLFDGDGGIGYSERKNGGWAVWFRITNASLSYLEEIQSLMFDNKGTIFKYKNKDCYEFRLSGINEVVYFCEKIYANQKFCLARKYEKYLLIKSFRDANFSAVRKRIHTNETT